MIFTFYSFKGGVGRSMAMANVAWELASRGLRVLAIDFDLEAPGLERYFRVPVEEVHRTPGVIDLIESFKRSLGDSRGMREGEFRQVERFIHSPVADFGRGGRLDLMPAGRRFSDDDKRAYALAVRTFDWQDFYFNWEGQAFFEWLRRRLVEGPEAPYDLVLADSRTGVTEMGGVCACQLADVVVMLSAPNHQNIEGTRELAADLRSEPVQRLRQGRTPLQIVVVPARVEQRVPGLLEDFEQRFEAAFASYRPAAHVALGLRAYDLALPYVPEFAFEEQVTHERGAQPGALDRQYTRLADALLVLCGEQASPALREAAAAARDALSARGGSEAPAAPAAPAFDPTRRWAGMDAYLSCAADAREQVARLFADLADRTGVLRTEFSQGDLFGSDTDLPPVAQEQLRHADSLVLFADARGVRPWQRSEVALARSLPRPPVLLQVLLPFAPEDAFELAFGKALSDCAVIDLRRWPEDDAGVWLLAQALRRRGRPEKEGAAEPQHAASHAAGDAVPFPGAAPYGEEHAAFFEGRGPECSALLESLRRQRRIVLHGPAGAGKTSLVRAGLFPALRAARLFEQLHYVDLREPDASALARWKELPSQSLLVLDHADACDEQRLAEVAACWRADGAASPAVLLVWRAAPLAAALAQAERRWEHEAAAAVRDRGHPLHGEAGLGPWRELLASAPHAEVPLQPLAAGALREALEKALGRAGRRCEAGLLERVFADAMPQVAAATVQRAMLLLWNEQARGWLTNDAYDRAGGIVALATAALDAVLEAVPPQPRAALLQRLVQRGPDGTPVLATMGWARSGSQPALRDGGPALAEGLARAGLLAIWREDGDIRLALACRPREWPALERWLEPAEPVRREVEAIARAYAAWLEDRWSAESLLAAKGVSAAARPWLSRGELAFADHRQVVQRRQRRAIGAVALGLVALVVAFVAERARVTQQAEDQAYAARLAASEAQRAKTEIAATQQAVEDARSQQRVAAYLPVGARVPAAVHPRLKLAVYRTGTSEAEAAAVMKLLAGLPAQDYELPAGLSEAPRGTCGEVAFFHGEDAAAARRLFDALNALLAKSQDLRSLELADRSLVANEVPRGTVHVRLPPQALGPALRQDRWGDSVLVPAGCAIVGSDQKSRDTLRRALDAPELDWYATELPAHREWIAGFYIGRTEVTARAFAEYQKACEARSPDCPPWRPRYLDPQREPLRPATWVSWRQADAYCRWAGGRLPTDLEWEKAARGTDGRFWPWGFQPDDSLYQGKGKKVRSPVAVGSHPEGRSPYGALDMAGNVWEYTSDLWQRSGHTIRGGSYLNTLMESRASVRWAAGGEDTGSEYLGFRCVAATDRAGS